MLELLLIIPVGALAIFGVNKMKKQPEIDDEKEANRAQKLWRVAQVAMVKKKYIPAERALLAILKIDHKNAAAYNRLGILYAKQQKYSDAIECFEIASSIEQRASSLHNLGLIYMETEQLDKAARAFEKALELEPLAARYIAYAKVQKSQSKMKEVIQALEKACELEPNPQTLNLLMEAYESTGETQKIAEVKKQLETVTLPKREKKPVKRRFVH